MVDFPGGFSNEPLPVGTRLACCIEYNGSRFSGWQSQPHLAVDTVQETVEAALASVATKPVKVSCAGRTDSGVHSVGQIIHFDDPVGRSCKNWVYGANANLPVDIRVVWAKVVADKFHARFSALSRRYRYIIANRPIRPALMVGQVTWARQPLDAEIMHTAAQALLGEQDFTAFRAASCQSPTAMRNVSEVTVQRRGQLVIIDIEANAFLHHMVRNIAGSLISVGNGRHPIEWIGELLAGRDRSVAADTAAPHGLYLAGVRYPEKFELPDVSMGPIFAPD
ncbi:MAG: tRNA pseudouridine(38-40) synthase TruA [Halioglobus sp.]